VHTLPRLDVDGYADDATVLSFGPRMVCPSCGIICADARPNWREQTERPSLTGNAMAKLNMPSDAAKALTVPERLLLLCVASAIDLKRSTGGIIAVCDKIKPL
jgi:hypothetical protein